MREIEIHGGQGGHTLAPLGQGVSPPNSQNCPIEISGTSETLPNKIALAGAWLHRNRDAVRGPVLPFIRRKFDLTILEAIDAAKLAHSLQYGGVGHDL